MSDVGAVVCVVAGSIIIGVAVLGPWVHYTLADPEYWRRCGNCGHRLILSMSPAAAYLGVILWPLVLLLLLPPYLVRGWLWLLRNGWSVLGELMVGITRQSE